MIFTKNPVLGKVKTRLAKTIGNKAALQVYQILLTHTQAVAQLVNADREVHYSEKVEKNDFWNSAFFTKKQQKGADLGKRMAHAFEEGFRKNYTKIIIIGSDLYDIQPETIERAFQALETHQVVIGPAQDGGYYLLGMTSFIPAIFQQKKWSTATVLKDTLADLKNHSVKLLDSRNDIDTYNDLKNSSIPIKIKQIIE